MKRPTLVAGALICGILFLVSGIVFGAISNTHVASAQFNPAPLDPWIATSSPNVGITQRTKNNPLVITGLTAGQCLTTDANHKVIGVTCGSGGGSSTFGTSSLSAVYPVVYTQSASLAQFSVAYGTTTANSWSAFNNFTYGINAILSSSTNATTTGSVYFTSLTSGLLNVDGNGKVYKAATSSWAGTGLSSSAGAFNVNTTQNITTLSNLTTAGTVNTTASGVLYTTGTSTPAVTAPITYSGTLGQFIGGVSGNFGCTSASSAVTGCLTGADWTTFNNKISSTSLSQIFPFTPTTNFGAAANATGTPIWFQGGLQASSTSQFALTAFHSGVTVVRDATQFGTTLLGNSAAVGSISLTLPPTTGYVLAGGDATGVTNDCVKWVDQYNITDAGAPCGSGSGASFSYPFPLLGLGTTSPIMLLASTTIGAGGTQTGLTVSGNSTTSLALSAGSNGFVVNSGGTIIKVGNGTVGITSSVLQMANSGGDVVLSNNVGGAANSGLSFQTGISANDAGSAIKFVASAVERFRVNGQGFFGIASTSPYARLSVQGNPTDSTIATTLFAVGSSTATATSTLFAIMNTGKIGVGTAAPGTSDGSSGTTGTTGFDVANGDVRISAGRLNLSTIGNNAEYLYSPSGSGIDYWGARNDLILQADNDNNGTGNIIFETGNSGANTTGSKVTMTTAGNFGIGTTSPYAALSVVGSTGVVADHYTATSTTPSLFQGGLQAFASSTIGSGAQAGGLVISGGATTTGSAAVLGVLNVGSTNGGSTGDARATRIVSDTFTSLSSGAPSFSQSIRVNNNSQVSYFTGTDGSGNVLGVGTTSPYKALAVGGDIVVGASTAGGTIGDLFLPKLGTAAGTFIAVDATGKVIATTTPTGSASLTGTTGQNAYFSGTNTAVGTSTIFTGTNSHVGVGPTSTPYALFNIQAGSTTALTNNQLFVISSTSASSATTTLLSVDNTGAEKFSNPAFNALKYPSWTVNQTWQGADFTTIQGALDACGTAGGGSIYLTDTNYSQGSTGLLWKGSNCNVYGRSYGTTTINFTGATPGFKTNSPSSTYSLDGIHNVKLLGDGTAGSIAIDNSDLLGYVEEGIRADNWDTGVRYNDTQNTSFYAILRDSRFTTIKSFGINASSTSPVNDNTVENVFIGCVGGGAGMCIGLNLNNAQANQFNKVTLEPTSNVRTQCVQIRSNNLSTNNGTFANDFNGIYCEGNQIGISASSTDNRSGNAAVHGNNFYGGQIETNTINKANESADSIETSYFGTEINFMNTNLFATTTIMSKNNGTLLTLNDQGFSNVDLNIINNTNFAKSTDFLLVNALNTTDSGNGVDSIMAGTGAALKGNSSGTGFALLLSASSTGFAATSTGKVIMHGLTVTTSGNAVCDNTATNEIENAGASACVVSSAKAKHDIETITQSTAQEIMALRPVQYVLNGGDEARYGFIAEEAAKVDPKIVEYAQTDTTVTGLDGKPVPIKKGEPLTFDYARYVGLLTAFVQDQQHQIEALQRYGVAAKRSVEENWQWLAIGLLGLWNIYLTFRRKK